MASPMLTNNDYLFPPEALQQQQNNGTTAQQLHADAYDGTLPQATTGSSYPYPDLLVTGDQSQLNAPIDPLGAPVLSADQSADLQSLQQTMNQYAGPQDQTGSLPSDVTQQPTAALTDAQTDFVRKPVSSEPLTNDPAVLNKAAREFFSGIEEMIYYMAYMKKYSDRFTNIADPDTKKSMQEILTSQAQPFTVKVLDDLKPLNLDPQTTNEFSTLLASMLRATKKTPIDTTQA